jgi:acetyl esterase/lipase
VTLRAFFVFLVATGSAPAFAAESVQIGSLLDGPPPQMRVYKTRQGTPLHLYYFRPEDTAAGAARPAVVWIHGGAWVGGTTERFMAHARYVARRGAVGFNIEYRLLKPDGPFIETCIADCRSALRYIRAHAAELGVDPTRIAAAGDSAGGHLAAALAMIEGGEDPDDDRTVSGRPDALLLFNPVADLTEGDWVRYAVGGPALADKSLPRPSSPEAWARARALSPVFHARPGLPPTLLMHGMADTVVPVAQAERLSAALRAAGNRCDLVLVPDAGHAFVLTRWKAPESHVVDAIRTADRFLVSLGWLSGEPTLTVSPEPAWTPLPSGPAR